MDNQAPDFEYNKQDVHAIKVAYEDLLQEENRGFYYGLSMIAISWYGFRSFTRFKPLTRYALHPLYPPILEQPQASWLAPCGIASTPIAQDRTTK